MNKRFTIPLSENLPPGEKTKNKIIVYSSLLLIFTISLVYFYFFGGGIFFYQENNSLFIYSYDYFEKFISKPGGFLVYAGNFLTQFYFNTLPGSVIISSLVILFCFVFIKINERMNAASSFSLLFILLPGSLLLIFQTRYDHFIHLTLGYLAATSWYLCSIISVKTRMRFIFLSLFPVFYFLAGSFAFIYLGLKIITILLNENGIRRFFSTSILIGIAFLTFFIFKEFIFLQPVIYLTEYPLLFDDYAKHSAYLYLFSVFIVLYPLFIHASSYIILNKKLERIIPVASILIIFILTTFFLIINFQPVHADLMKTEKLVHMRDWDSIIKRHEKSPSTNIIGQYYYNLALTEKGLLCDRMFIGNQSYGPMSLILPRNSEHMYRAVYYYYAIGLIGEAHHLAYELMVQHGYRPENIKMLIKTELINRNYLIAEQYINVLKKTFHYRKWAEHYEKMVFNPALISADPELSEKTRLIPEKDFFVVGDDLTNLELFMQVSPYNKRVFETKMARLLLEKDIIEVVSQVNKMKNIGYNSLPRHIEEAVIAYKYFTKQVPDLGGLSIKPETEMRFNQYISVFNYYGGKKAILEKMMKRSEKSTFWYFLQFNSVKMDFRRSMEDKYFVY